MPTELFANNAQTTVSSGGTTTPAAGVTETWTVASSTGFPVASNAASPSTQFTVVDPAAQGELVRVTNVSGTTWTVIRGVEGTTPVAHSAGFTVAAIVTRWGLTSPTLGGGNLYALRQWYAALAGVQSAPADIYCLGDSITEGANCTSPANRWVDQMRDQLRTLYPVQGAGGGANYIPAYYTTASLPAPMTLAGTPSRPGGFGLGARDIVLSTSAHSATATVTGTSVRLYHQINPGSGVGSWQLDGGTVNTFSAAGTLSDAGQTTITFPTRGTHTIVVKWSSGGPVYFEGMAVFDGDETKGVRVWESGYYGATTQAWLDVVNDPVTYGPFFIQRTGVIQPDLFLVELGTNDYASGTISAATFKTNLATIIGVLKTTTTIPPSIMLVVVHQRSTAGITPINPWGDYVQAMYEVADTDPAVGIIDLNPRMPAVDGDVLGLYSDTVHPSDKGQISYGAAIANAVTSDQKPAPGQYFRTRAISLTPTANSAPSVGDIWFDPATSPNNTPMINDGVGSVPLARTLSSRLTAAATSTVVTYAGTGLSVSVAAGVSYRFRASGQYRTAALTTGIGLRVGGTCTATGIRYVIKTWGAATSASTPTVVTAAALATASLTANVVAATTDYLWEIEGVIRVNAAGTLTVDFASEVAGSTATIQPDSFLLANLA